MIEPSKLIVGMTCYSLMYYGPPNPDLMIPSITAYIYTGKNLRETEAGGDRWWLQDPTTYMLYGALIDFPKEFRSGVRIADERFMSTLFDLEGLIAELQKLGGKEQEESSEMVLKRAYYFVSYYDPDLTIPIFDAYIYVGTGEDHEEDKVITLYLFQEPSTYAYKAVKGDAPEVEDADMTSDITSLHRFYDLHRLTSLLSDLRDRTDSFGSRGRGKRQGKRYHRREIERTRTESIQPDYTVGKCSSC